MKTTDSILRARGYSGRSRPVTDPSGMLRSTLTPKRSYPSFPRGLGRPIGRGASCTHSALVMGLTLYLAWNCAKPPWSTMTSWSMSLPFRMLDRVSSYICEDELSTRFLVTNDIQKGHTRAVFGPLFKD